MNNGNQIIIDTRKSGEPLGDLFGIFFEDINHAADGGLYAEMIQNRSFEFDSVDHPDYHHLTAWEKIEHGSGVELSIQDEDAVDKHNPHYLRMEVTESGKGSGVRNKGFGKGMYFEGGKEYLFSCYARCKKENTVSKICITMEDLSGRIYANGEFSIDMEWKKYELTLKPSSTEHQGSIVLTLPEECCIELDLVSLFPKDTYKGRTNGLRKDLVEALKDLKPRFMRFPGGCLIHTGSLDSKDRTSMYRWKNSIGPVEKRPARRNNWGYNQTLGLGYYEYFLLCEDIGAKPVPILPAAYDPHHQRMAPLDALDEWIDDALDLIEFANGDSNTKWGKIRADLGHVEPFGMEYIGIGNEEVGEGYVERLPYFVRAIREKYPDIKIIGSSGPFCAGGEFDRGWNSACENHIDIVDEHYYMAPEWFIANMDRYAKYKKNAPAVFLGEYGTWGNCAENAMVEAAFMTQMQNNAQVVKMACYAPLFCNSEYINWRPDLIWFTNDKVCKTVNYQVQKLFMNHQGDELLPSTLLLTEEKEEKVSWKERIQGEVHLAGSKSEVEYSNIRVCNEDTGETENYPDGIVNGEEYLTLRSIDASNYTIKMHAKEITGKEGFKIFFAWRNSKNKICWELGGWQNLDGAITEEYQGRWSCLTQSEFRVEQGREYELELRIREGRIEGWIDGQLFQETKLDSVEVEPVYFTASIEKNSSDIIVKAVNLRNKVFETEVLLEGLQEQILDCDQYILHGMSSVESADFSEVEEAEIIQTQERISLYDKNGKGCFAMNVPEYSVMVLRLKRSKE